MSLVYPVYTETEFASAEARKTRTLLPRGPVQSAEHVARAVVRCIRRPRLEVYPYRAAKVLAVLSVLVPGLADRLIDRVRRDAAE